MGRGVTRDDFWPERIPLGFRAGADGMTTYVDGDVCVWVAPGIDSPLTHLHAAISELDSEIERLSQELREMERQGVKNADWYTHQTSVEEFTVLRDSLAAEMRARAAICVSW